MLEKIIETVYIKQIFTWGQIRVENISQKKERERTWMKTKSGPFDLVFRFFYADGGDMHLLFKNNVVLISFRNNLI